MHAVRVEASPKMHDSWRERKSAIKNEVGMQNNKAMLVSRCNFNHACVIFFPYRLFAIWARIKVRAYLILNLRAYLILNQRLNIFCMTKPCELPLAPCLSTSQSNRKRINSEDDSWVLPSFANQPLAVDESSEKTLAAKQTTTKRKERK